MIHWQCNDGIYMFVTVYEYLRQAVIIHYSMTQL